MDLIIIAIAVVATFGYMMHTFDKLRDRIINLEADMEELKGDH
tara:strand:+ start:4187 stop:4315 length:129 start_codon:yes stop_codon:yes gene_type:complete